MRSSLPMVLVMVALLAGGCDGQHSDMGPMGPGGPTSAFGAGSLASVSPAGGAVGVATDVGIVLHFGTGMAQGMEEFVDLHRADLSGPTIPLSCLWSADRTTLTCSHERLQPQMLYWLHVGGGMMSQLGQPIDFDEHGPAYGGQWIQGGMMAGGFHAGLSWGAMASGWRHGNGSYGMAFSFTTG